MEFSMATAKSFRSIIYRFWQLMRSKVNKLKKIRPYFCCVVHFSSIVDALDDSVWGSLLLDDFVNLLNFLWIIDAIASRKSMVLKKCAISTARASVTIRSIPYAVQSMRMEIHRTEINIFRVLWTMMETEKKDLSCVPCARALFPYIRPIVICDHIWNTKKNV